MNTADKIYKIGWFSTGRDEAACELLKVVHDNIKRNKLRNCAISFVFSNRTKGEKQESDSFFRLVENSRINLVTFSSQRFIPALRKKGRELTRKGDLSAMGNWRNLYDLEVKRLIEEFRIDFIVLAGYMLIVGDSLCHDYPMINLHPALPSGPRGTWQAVIWQLIEDRATESGVMMHLVTPQLDAGPIVTYCSFPSRGGTFNRLWEKMERKLKTKTLAEVAEEEAEAEPLFRKIREEGVKRELPLIVHTLKAISEKKIGLREGKVTSKGQEKDGYCVNQAMAKEIKNDTG